MEEKNALKEVFLVFGKRFWLIFSLTIGAALIAGIISFYFLTPMYQISSQFLVNQNKLKATQMVSENDVRTNVELINTYKAIIQSPRILDQVSDELGLKMSSEQLAKKIDLLSEESSQVVTVFVTDTDPKRAADIANTTVAIFQKEIPQLMNVDNVKVLSEAKPSSHPEPISPNKLLNIAIALILGAMTGIGLAFLLEYFDNTIKKENDIVLNLQTPVLGVISHIKEKELAKNQTIQSNQEKKKGVVLDGAS